MEKVETLSAEEMTLRRRARRRLVGAVALALLAVVVLPMLFDPQPKPLGPEVDIRIPEQSTPLQPVAPIAAVPAPAATPASSPAATPAAPAPVAKIPAPAEPQQQATQQAADAKTVAKVADKSENKPASSKPVSKESAKDATKHASKDAGKDAAKHPTKAEPASPPSGTGKGYFLQLGVFSSESNARQLAEKVRAAGFGAAVQKTDGQVRVRLGPYKSREEAMPVQIRLREKGFNTVLVGP